MFKPMITALALGAALSAFGQAPDTLKGNITASYTLDSSKVWYLSGFVAVDSPHVLSILPGTTVKGMKSTQGTLAIKPGAKLIAAGTKEKPITFTSDEPEGSKTRASWGGIVLLGRAKTNKGSDKFEAREDWLYGGTNEDDSSGVLKYVRLEYPGFPVAPDKELNGVTLAAVGRKTVLSYVQVHGGDDDGFEWFGGNVNADHLVVTNQVDDGFDSDNGFSGKVQWGINVQAVDGTRTRTIPRTGLSDTTIIETVGDRCFESSSDKGGSAGTTPRTQPTWANITCVDNGKSGGPITLNENAQGLFERSLFIGDSSAYAVTLQSSATNAGLLATVPTVDFKKSYLGGTFKNKFVTNDSANATVIKDLLGTILPSLGSTLYKDLGPKNDTLIRDSVGAIVGGDPAAFWYQGWTFANTVSWSKGEDRIVGLRRAQAPVVQGPFEAITVRMSARGLLLVSAFAAPVTVELLDMSGRRVFVREGVRLSAGENELGRPWGDLKAGNYFLAVRSGDYSVHYRIGQAER